MKIIYVANHDQVCSNDDEGAITHALTVLGHNVQRLPESKGGCAAKMEGDLLLFHKWHDTETLRQVRMKKVFWYFDLVEYPDPTIQQRSLNRMGWMKEIIPLVDLGFCTDGDWAAKNSKLEWLTQGADERTVGAGVVNEQHIDVLFTGIRKGGGIGRESFVDDIGATYGNRFRHLSHGVHGRDLAHMIASSKVVLAPDTPISDRYWSNRVYLSCGFGAFLLHPDCLGIHDHYSTDEVWTYRSRSGLIALINYALGQDKARDHASKCALSRTKRHHLYRHRCERMLDIIETRLGVK